MRQTDTFRDIITVTVNQATGPMVKFVPVLGEKKESSDILYQDLGNGARPVQVSYSVIVFAPTPKRVQECRHRTFVFWRENSDSPFMEDR